MLCLFYTSFIAYASLFEHGGSIQTSPNVGRFLTGRSFYNVSRSDLIANLVAYVPLGFLLVLLLRAQAAKMTGILIVTLLGTSLSLLMEFVQLFLPSRISSYTDLVANVLGVFVGAMVGGIFANTLNNAASARRREVWLDNNGAAIAFLIAFALWAIYQWFPWIPTFDVGTIKQNLTSFKQVIQHQQTLQWPDVFSYSFMIIGLGLLARYACAIGTPWWPIFAASSGLVLIARIFVQNRGLAVEAFLGYIVAAIMLLLLAAMPRNRAVMGSLASLALICGFGVAELTPGLGKITAFNWVPLYGEISNNLNGIANLLNLLWISMALGASLCMLAKPHGSPRIAWLAVLIVGVIFFVFEWMQIRIPGRQGDITASLMGMLGAAWGSYLASARQWWPESEQQGINRASMPGLEAEAPRPTRKQTAFDTHDQAIASRARRGTR